MANLHYIRYSESYPPDGNEDEHKYHFTCGCTHCSKTKVITVKAEDLFKWHNHMGLIQEIFPYLSPGDREQLCQSGICNECFDKLFSEEES